MPIAPNANVCRVIHRFDRAGFPVYNVMYHLTGVIEFPEQAAAVATVLGTLFTNTILEQQSSAINYEECIAYSMASETAPVGAWSAPDPSPGGINNEGTNRASAAVITLRTANRGRSARGRMYIACLSEPNVTNGVIDGAYAASLELAAENYRTGAAAEEMPLIVYSQYTAGALRAAGLAQTVTSVELRSAILGSQRRRNHRP